eukprot:3028506-Rhodomonas_salina.1
MEGHPLAQPWGMAPVPQMAQPFGMAPMVNMPHVTQPYGMMPMANVPHVAQPYGMAPVVANTPAPAVEYGAGAAQPPPDAIEKAPDVTEKAVDAAEKPVDADAGMTDKQKARKALMPFVIISVSYLLYTITDGSVRMIVLLHAYNKSFSAMEVFHRVLALQRHEHLSGVCRV